MSVMGKYVHEKARTLQKAPHTHHESVDNCVVPAEPRMVSGFFSEGAETNI